MIAFEDTVKEAQKAFGNWDKNRNTKEITVIRDVLGKLSFLLDTDNSVTNSDIDNLKIIFTNIMQKYFQGSIYWKQARNNDLVQKIILETENTRWSLDDEDTRWFILERAIAKKAWIECGGHKEAIWTYKEAQCGSKPKVITFYSFKGGMGRTTSLAGVALGLANEGSNVLAIDTDVEAPGLASLFLNDSDVKKGTVDYLLEAAVTPENIPIDMTDIVCQVDDIVSINNEKGKIFIVPAGKMDMDYLIKLARIDYQDNVPNGMRNLLTRLIHDAVREVSKICQIDYILLDARAGFHDMGGVVTNELPHGVLLFGKDTKQSWQGVELVLNSISRVQADKPSVAIVDSAYGAEGFVSEDAKKSFTGQAYTVFSNTYYAGEAQHPSPEATGEPHSPIFVPYSAFLTDNVQLYSDGSERENNRVEELKQILLSDCYNEMIERIKLWFDQDED